MKTFPTKREQGDGEGVIRNCKSGCKCMVAVKEVTVNVENVRESDLAKEGR
jgi:hypothetical protein